MKYCPVCDERYDEEIIKFCTKDGAPLVDEEEPTFTTLPSESIEEPDADFGEETIIRRKPESVSPVDIGESERIIIPTTTFHDEPVRPRTTAAYYPPLQPPNTAKTVVLTILGTIAVMGLGALIFWLLQPEAPANFNVNFNGDLANQNTNLNTNLGFDSNFNFNTNANFNSNFNFNANFNTNLKTPTPRPSPVATASPTPRNSPTPAPSPTVRPTANTRPSPAATPRMGPRPPTMTNRAPGNGGN